MGKFKVGDKVRVREWDNMAKEFGVDLVGNIECIPTFVDNMKCYCGGVYKILENTRVSYVLEGAGGYFFSEETLFPAITYREYMQENYPEDVDDSFFGGILGCPHYKGDFFDFSKIGQCGFNCVWCKECWDQYMTEAEYKKYVLKEEGEKEMFKVGDYVKVVKPVGGRTVSWVRTMDWTVGKVFKISKVDSDNTCQLEGVDSVWVPFEALKPATPKDMLSPLCTVKTRNGNIYLFDGYRLLRERGHLDFDTHDEYLNARYSSDYDVIDICKPSGKNANILDLLTMRGECIWKQEEVVEITAEEAAKKLSEQYPGQTVKIVC